MKRLFGLLLLVAFALTFSLTSCTENQRAKSFGGTASIDLEPGQKLIVATWKDDNLWVLTRDMEPKEVAETYNFFEESSWGVWEGNYIIRESRKH